MWIVMFTNIGMAMQYYTNSGYSIQLGKISSVFLTPRGVEAAEEAQRDHMPVRFSIHDLAKTFPEAKQAVKRAIKRGTEQLQKYNETKLEIQYNINGRSLSIKDKSSATGFLHALINEYMKPIERKLKHDRTLLSFWESKKTLGKSLDFARRIEMAKQVSISDYIQFNRGGFANCVWHNEDTPSMKYYKDDNHVKCFGCGKHGDVLDVIQQVQGCDLNTAVTTLIGG